MPLSCLLNLLELPYESNMRKWVGRTRSVSDFHKIFINAFIITTLNSLWWTSIDLFFPIVKKISDTNYMEQYDP